MIYNHKLDPLSIKSPFLNFCYFLVTNYKTSDKLEIVKEIVNTYIPTRENSIFLQQTRPISEKFKVLKYENLEEDFNKFCIEIFGKTTSLIKINDSKFNFYNEFVRNEEEKILNFVREAYKKDLEMFYPEELNDP
jgi:exonuclease I